MKRVLFLVVALMMLCTVAFAESTLDEYQLPQIPPFVTVEFGEYQEGIASFFIQNWTDNGELADTEGFMTDKGVVFGYDEWDSAQFFSEGLAKVKKGDKWGVIDTTGAVVIEPSWDYFGTFREGLAYAGMNTEDGQKRYGFVNPQGEFVIEPVYEAVKEFRNGYAAAMKDGLYGLIDQKGNMVIPFEWENLYYFDGETIMAKKDGKFGVIDLQNNVMVDFVWDNLSNAPDSLGWRVATKEDKCGFVDKQGNLIIDCKYDSAGAFVNDGYAVVKAGDLWGIIDRNDNFIFEPQFKEINGLGAGVAYAEKSEDSGKNILITYDGQIIGDMVDVFDGMIFDNSDGLCRYRAISDYHSSGWGFVDLGGNVVIEPEWVAATDFSGGYAFVWDKDGQVHLIDTQGQIVK